MRHQGPEGIIYEAMAGDAAEVFEARAGDLDAEMAAIPSAGVAGVQVAVVLHRERFRSEGKLQRRFDLGGRDGHGGSRRDATTAAPGLVSSSLSSCSANFIM